MGKCQLTCVCRYRYSLTENKRALVKFLYSVNWDDETEVSTMIYTQSPSGNNLDVVVLRHAGLIFFTFYL